MVDVQVGVLGEARVDEVDELLERLPLGVVVVRVQRREVAVDVEDPPEVLERAVRVPERVALEVEEEVARRGVGQEREAGFGLLRQQPVDVLAGLARVQLELGLLAQSSPSVSGLIPAGTGSAGARPSAASVVIPAAASFSICVR